MQCRLHTMILRLVLTQRQSNAAVLHRVISLVHDAFIDMAPLASESIWLSIQNICAALLI